MRGPLAILVGSSAVAALALALLIGAPGPRHWSAAPLLAASIVVAMGGLAVVVPGTGARRGRGLGRSGGRGGLK